MNKRMYCPPARAMQFLVAPKRPTKSGYKHVAGLLKPKYIWVFRAEPNELKHCDCEVVFPVVIGSLPRAWRDVVRTGSPYPVVCSCMGKVIE